MANDQTSTRRAAGDGSLGISMDGKRADLRISLGGGQRRRRTLRRMQGETLAKFRRRAHATLDEMRAEVDAGRTSADRYTVATYSVAFLASVEGAVAESTHASYERVLTTYVVPHIGTRWLDTLTVDDIEHLDAKLAGRSLSVRTRRAARQALGRMLRHAKGRGLVARLVIADAERIRGSRGSKVDESRQRTESALDAEQLGALIAAARSARVDAAEARLALADDAPLGKVRDAESAHRAAVRSEALVALLAVTGLRRSEALGLGWDSVDLDAGTIEVRRALTTIDRPGQPSRIVLDRPKTEESERTVTVAPQVLQLLATWQTRQAEESAAIRWYAPTFRSESGDDVALVFTDPTGAPIKPHTVRRLLNRLGNAAGLGDLNPHKLRHSAASVLIEEGETATAIAAQLGHASPAITMSIYAHALKGARERTGSKLGEAVFGNEATGL